MPKISKRTVDAAAPRSTGRFFLWDDTLKGFGLLVLPTGVKSYVFQFRDQHGRSRRATIGKHGKFTPDVARDRAHELQRAVAEGRNPLAEKRAAREALSTGDLIDRYLASKAFSDKAPSTQAIDRGRIERHLRPTLGRTLLPALTVADIERAHRAICDGKTAVDMASPNKRGRIRVRGGEGTARMAIRLLRAILGWGIRNRLLTENVAEHVEVGRDGRRTQIVSDASAYARLFSTLNELESEKAVRTEVADAIRLIALTGARRGEITGLQWRHVDLKAGTITLPPKEHKAGRATGEDRVIGLPALAQSIIARQHAGEPGEAVFRATGGVGCLDLSKPWRRIRERAGLPNDIGLHGLRHSLASHMAMSGMAASEIMQTLGHKDISTSQRYVHWARDQRQGLAEKAAAGVSAALRSVREQDVAK